MEREERDENKRRKLEEDFAEEHQEWHETAEEREDMARTAREEERRPAVQGPAIDIAAVWRTKNLGEENAGGFIPKEDIPEGDFGRVVRYVGLINENKGFRRGDWKSEV